MELTRVKVSTNESKVDNCTRYGHLLRSRIEMNAYSCLKLKSYIQNHRYKFIFIAQL